MVYRYDTRYAVPKSKEWIFNILLAYDDIRFKCMLRVIRLQIKLILEELESDFHFHKHNSVQQFPISIQLSIVLYKLGFEGGGIRKTAAQFGIGDGGTVSKITRRIFSAIGRLKGKFLFCPSENERKEICAATNNELPGCVGYLDGTEIRLAEAPNSEP